MPAAARRYRARTPVDYASHRRRRLVSWGPHARADHALRLLLPRAVIAVAGAANPVSRLRGVAAPPARRRRASATDGLLEAAARQSAAAAASALRLPSIDGRGPGHRT